MWIEIFPTGAQQDALNFLTLPIEAFEAKDVRFDAGKGSASAGYPAQIGCPTLSARGGIASSFGVGLGGDRIVNVQASDRKVREILGLLIVSAGGTSWVVTYPGKASLSVRGFRRSISYLTNEIPPDNQQPVFVFMPWEGVRARRLNSAR